MGRVEGKVVVVTGAAGGQGAAEARGAGQRGRDGRRDRPARDGPPVSRIARRSPIAALDVDEPRRLDARSANGCRAPRSRRRAGQQRGRPLPRAARRRSQIADWDRVIDDQPDRPAARDPDGRAADARGRLDRQHQLGGRADGATRRRLHGQQVGRAGPVAGRQPGARPPRDPRQHGAARLHRDADDGLRARRRSAAATSRRRRSAGRGRATRSRRSSST